MHGQSPRVLNVGTSSGASCEHTSLRILVVVFELELAAGRGEEGFLERLRLVAVLELAHGLQAEQSAAVEDSDPVGQDLGLGQVVRAEQDRGIVRGPDLANEVLYLELRAR